jgi:sulfur carrier protein ThiS
MNDKQTAKWIVRDCFYALVSLLTLVSFVVAQSVYEVLASNQEFLTVRRVSNLQLAETILVFNLLLPLVLFLLWALCQHLHRGLARAFLAAMYLLLFLAFFLQIHNAYLADWQPFPHFYLLWVAPASILLFASLKFEKPFRFFMLALSPVVLLFPALFLYRTWSNPASMLPEASLAFQQEVSRAEKKNFPPIFFLVLDGLTQHALLDKDGQIDGTRFPNFKALAEESFWFRNTTANAGRTHKSIPVMLTGNFPHGDDPSYEAYPDNLFALLHPYYDIYIHEVLTHFCVPRLHHCPDAEIASGYSELLKDVFYLYAARILPKNVSIGLPDLTTSWGPFRRRREEMAANIRRFQSFVDSLGSSGNDSIFYFMHHLLPHAPYGLTAEGEIYEVNPEEFREYHVGNVPLMKDLRDRYLMQVAYVDKQIGSFISRLKQLDLYGKSLIIVTSDHGVSWKPEAPGRSLRLKNAEMILSVPLFIKVPFQRRGMASDVDAQHIDLVPTVADLLGLQVPWQHAGRSVFYPKVKPRLKVAYDDGGTRLEFPRDLGLARVEVPFDAQKSPFIGQEIKAFQIDRYETVRGYLDALPVPQLFIPPDSEEFSVYVSGWAVLLDQSSVPDKILVALNDEIVAVTSPCCERRDVAKGFENSKLLRSGWSTSFASRELREGINMVTAYVLMDAEKKELASLKRARRNVIFKGGPVSQPDSPLVGKMIDQLNVRRYETIRGNLDSIDIISEVRLGAESGTVEIPISVSGWAVLLEKSSVPEQIAVAINDEIVAVISPCCDRPSIAKDYKDRNFLKSGWFTLLSSQQLREGENLIKAYAVLDTQGNTLAALSPCDGNMLYKTPAGVPTTSPLLGKRVRAFSVKRYEAVRGHLDTLSESSLNMQSDSEEFPIYVSGWAALLDKSSIPDQIAVAVNGEIVAVTSPCCDRPDVAREYQNQNFLESGWSASFSSRKLKEGKNTVAAYVILDGEKQRLALLNTIENTIEVTRK